MVPKGKSVKLRWSSENATSFDLEPGIGPVQARGEQDVTPQEDTDYTLVVSGPGGRTKEIVHVKVWDANLGVRPTATLTPTLATIQRGQWATLTWTSKDGTSLDLQPSVGKVNPNASFPVAPQKTTDYTLTVSGPGGIATATARVVVVDGPVVVQAGTLVSVQLVTGVDTSSKDMSAGQMLPATVASPIRANGREVISAGVPAQVVLAGFKKAGRLETQVEVTLELRGLTIGLRELPVDCTPYRQLGPPRPFPPKPVWDTKSLQVKFPPGSMITFRLASPLVITMNP
jgi:hypothetical protein